VKTPVNTPITLQYTPINCTNEITFIHKPSVTHYLFLTILENFITWRWSLWGETCKHLLIL